MTHKTILGAVALAALTAASFSTVAHADAGQRGWGQKGGQMGGYMGQEFIFEEMDADGDGKVTQEEIAAYRAAKIAEMDTDKDGILSEAELLAAHQKRKAERESRMVKRMIERMDTNKDGTLSVEEMAAMPEDFGVKMFKRLDANGDGAISKEEADAAREVMGNRRGEKGEKRKGDRKNRGRN